MSVTCSNGVDMPIIDRLSDDLKTALKGGEKDRLSVIRMIKAAVKNKEIEKGDLLSDEEVCGVMTTLAKRAKDSIEQFSKGGRQELAEKEARELAIIQDYLPEQISEEELTLIINEVVTETGASGPGDMGRVMKSVMAKAKGQADGKLVSELVKKMLSPK